MNCNKEIEIPMCADFVITGVDTRGKRFKIETKNAIQAMGINLYRGNVWIVIDGKRQLIKRVYN